jgi:hypothetical protein
MQYYSFMRLRSAQLASPLQKNTESNIYFYVTDGNIMNLTDASGFLICCVIQHYAPVVGWGGGGTDA